MEYDSLILLTRENVSKLTEIANYKKTGKSCDFKEYGLRLPVNHDFFYVKSHAIQLGWTENGYNTAFIVVDVKKWLLTKLKYGI